MLVRFLYKWWGDATKILGSTGQSATRRPGRVRGGRRGLRGRRYCPVGRASGKFRLAAAGCKSQSTPGSPPVYTPRKRLPHDGVLLLHLSTNSIGPRPAPPGIAEHPGQLHGE